MSGGFNNITDQKQGVVVLQMTSSIGYRCSLPIIFRGAVHNLKSLCLLSAGSCHNWMYHVTIEAVILSIFFHINITYKNTVNKLINSLNF